jgi:hypothetical protein
MENAMEDVKKDGALAQDQQHPWAPWAYTGTDETSPRPFALSQNNSLPAMLVWLTMTTGTLLQNNMSDADAQRLADAVGLTKGSVQSIRGLMSRAGASFQDVANVFRQIGKPDAPSSYPPPVCPTLDDILLFASVALNREPKQP